MTGLNRQSDQIMSICCFVTDARLNVQDERGFEVVIGHGRATLDRMDEWCTRTHSGSGLTAACLESKITPEAAAELLLAYIKRFVPQPRSALLAGNSVHADKDFLSQPPYHRIIEHLHYRILDVSSIKEAAMRWAADDVLGQVPPKKGLHQAREDVLESIEEARFYRDKFFQPSP